MQFALADPDIVEEANISRQAFCDKEIGLPKTQALALRYSIAWGVDATAFVQEFDPKLIRYAYYKFATYFDLESGTARSLYITQQSVCGVLKLKFESTIGHLSLSN